MLPRVLHRAVARTSPCRALSSSSWSQAEVVHSCNAEREEKEEVSTHSALQRQQLEFCCLLCGWDVACKTCPFNWFDFDPRKFRTKRREQQGDVRRFAVSDEEVRRATETLGIAADSDSFGRPSLSQQQVKDAFRARALEWHPDCNSQPDAESVFKDILEAYELLLAIAR